MESWATCRQRVRLEPNANIVAGGFGGISSLIVGYPFDTVKVRLQTMDRGTYKGGIDCFKQMVMYEGTLSLYRGMSGLFLFATPRFALTFYGYSIGLNYFLGSFDVGGRPETSNEYSIPSIRQPKDITEETTPTKPNLKEVFCAGIVSQLAVVPIVTQPCERIKVLLQIQPADSERGQIACLREIISKNGFRQGLFRGTTLTYARDVPSFATYFLTYEAIRSFLLKEDAAPTQDNPPEAKKRSSDLLFGSDIWVTILAGSCAGVVGWAIAIPFDVIKNRHQAVHTGSVISTVMTLWRKEGLSGFYRGASPILARAIPANAAAFVGYETAISVISLVKCEKPPNV